MGVWGDLSLIALVGVWFGGLVGWAGIFALTFYCAGEVAPGVIYGAVFVWLWATFEAMNVTSTRLQTIWS